MMNKRAALIRIVDSRPYPATVVAGDEDPADVEAVVAVLDPSAAQLLL